MTLKVLKISLLTLILFSPAVLRADDFCYGQNQAMPDGSVRNTCLKAQCYRDHNGRGEVIRWVKTENDCRFRSVGRSWGYPGNYKNFYHDYWPLQR